MDILRISDVTQKIYDGTINIPFKVKAKGVTYAGGNEWLIATNSVEGLDNAYISLEIINDMLVIVSLAVASGRKSLIKEVKWRYTTGYITRDFKYIAK